MKNLTLLAAVAVTLMINSTFARAADAPKDGGKKVLYHVVALKFKPEATKDQIDAVMKAFEGLKTKIPTIQSLKWGTNVSPEKHDKGFTHCVISTFASEKDRDDYLPHPDHKAFGKVLGPVVADVFVIDFWAE
jgi:hypothetical protein